MGELGTAFGSPIGQSITPGAIIGNLVSAAIVVSGVIMVFLFIGGGIGMIASAGSGDAQGAAKGKEAVKWALIGFIVVFTSFWIIRIIEIWTGRTFITYPSFFTGGGLPQPGPGGGPF